MAASRLYTSIADSIAVKLQPSREVSAVLARSGASHTFAGPHAARPQGAFRAGDQGQGRAGHRGGLLDSLGRGRCGGRGGR